SHESVTLAWRRSQSRKVAPVTAAPVKLAARNTSVPSESAATAPLSPIGPWPTTAAPLRPLHMSAQIRSRQAAKPEVSGTGRTGARDLEPTQVTEGACRRGCVRQDRCRCWLARLRL